MGEGEFGRVFKAEAQGIKPNEKVSIVAVKTLKESATNVEYDILKKEIEVMRSVGKHENIVSLLGVSKKSGKKTKISSFIKQLL